MKAIQKLFLFAKGLLFAGAFFIVTLSSCKKEEPAPDPIASFQFEISQINYLQVTFTNYSQNAVSYAWNFGDGKTSTEKDPVHIYSVVGTYTVVLTATNKDGVSHAFQTDITITDPQAARKLLTGEVSKTWKLYRVGTSMGVGPSADNPRGWWALENDGQRPCVYFHEFTFTLAGQYIFDDKGKFWSEGMTEPPTCMDAIPANMVNLAGQNVSAWLSGTHTFEYNTTTEMVTLNGLGAWIGLPKLGTSAEVAVPQNSVAFKVTITQHVGYDLMNVRFTYTGLVWDFTYASYSNPALEPAVVTIAAPWGTNLPDLTPTTLFHRFESATSFSHIGAIAGTSVITVGEDDPAGGTTKVGKFVRVAGEQWQEAQLRTTPELNDIQFTNFTVAKIDIFIPNTTVFAEGGLQRQFVFGFADMSQTQQWWTSPVQFVRTGDAVVIGAWNTYTFDLTDVKARQDLDMIYLGIGGGGHGTEGTFYVRNLVFE